MEHRAHRPVELYPLQSNNITVGQNTGYPETTFYVFESVPTVFQLESGEEIPPVMECSIFWKRSCGEILGPGEANVPFKHNGRVFIPINAGAKSCFLVDKNDCFDINVIRTISLRRRTSIQFAVEFTCANRDAEGSTNKDRPYSLFLLTPNRDVVASCNLVVRRLMFNIVPGLVVPPVAVFMRIQEMLPNERTGEMLTVMGLVYAYLFRSFMAYMNNRPNTLQTGWQVVENQPTADIRYQAVVQDPMPNGSGASHSMAPESCKTYKPNF